MHHFLSVRLSVQVYGNSHEIDKFGLFLPKCMENWPKTGVPNNTCHECSFHIFSLRMVWPFSFIKNFSECKDGLSVNVKLHFLINGHISPYKTAYDTPILSIGRLIL